MIKKVNILNNKPIFLKDLVQVKKVKSKEKKLYIHNFKRSLILGDLIEKTLITKDGIELVLYYGFCEKNCYSQTSDILKHLLELKV